MYNCMHVESASQPIADRTQIANLLENNNWARR